MSAQHHRPRDRHFPKLPPPEQALVIDLTGAPPLPPHTHTHAHAHVQPPPPPPPPHPSGGAGGSGNGNNNNGALPDADIPTGVASAAKLYDAALCPRASTQNSRSGKRLKFAAQQPAQSPQFIQPSKVYSSNKHHLNHNHPATSTPPALSRGTSGAGAGTGAAGTGGNSARQKQIQPQPTRSDFARPSSRRDNKPKPYVLEAAPSGQLLPDSRCADFFPWRGNHPEDHVTDAQARGGQFDKLFVGKGNNEQASARAALAPIFKQKAGLTTISTLFLTVLDKRQNYGRFTTPSTFKPPPRVTLPDQRRETWLRDLASPVVPLRKLSRTIPHGLKGPVLLEQCTAKCIPTGRAVWFARCVGANELRGLKRKGVGSFAVGSETKWIKEWTTQVVRYLEGKITACGTGTGTGTGGGWKEKMVYAIQLSAHLYEENLLDRTLFLEWYLTYLESCSLDMLPMAYVLSSIYWDDLLRTRRLGRRLAEALLGKAEAILAEEEKEVFAPLMRKLSVMLTDILLSHRESLVISSSWDTYQRVLTQCVDTRLPTVRACLRSLADRNKNLLAPMDSTHTAATSPQRHIITALDATAPPYNLDALWTNLQSLTTDPAELVHTLCDWSTTTLRVGSHRVYVVAAILRAAQRLGVPVQEAVLAFIHTFGAVAGNKADVYLLVSELVRAKVFSVAAYLKWLIATGTLYGFEGMHRENPCRVRLLAEVPVYAATNQVRNLRRILLLNVGFDTGEEARALEEAKAILAMRVVGVFGGEAASAGESCFFEEAEMEFFGALSRAVVCELGMWIKDNVRMHVVKGQPVGRDNWRDLSVEVGITAVTTNQFVLLRQLLELFCDLSVLADVVKMVSSSDSSSTLAQAADTVSYNIEAFCALGAANECLRLLHNRYKKLQLRRPLERYLLVSLADLACAFPAANEAVRTALLEDLAALGSQCPRAAMMANSPVSDTMDVFDGEAADGNDEIDRLLAGGAGADTHSLSRLFETIVSKVETTFDDTGTRGQLASSVAYLTKLRQVDAAGFDELMRGWVTRLLLSSSRPPLLHTMSVLVAGSCLELEVVVSAALAALKGGKAVGEIAVQTLGLLVRGNGEGGLSLLEAYSLNRKRKMFERSETEMYVRLVCRAIELGATATATNSELGVGLRALVLATPVLKLLRGLATARPEMLIAEVVEPLSKTGSALVLQWLRVLIDHLLDDHESGDMTDLDPEVQVAQLIQYANDFSIGLCQLKMRIIFDAENKRGSADNIGGSSENPLTKPFFQGIASTFKDRVNIWTDLVSVLNQECAAQIRQYAEELVLNSSTFPPVRLCLGPLEPSLSEGREESGESLARALLSVIEATAYSIPPNGVAAIAAMLVEKLNMIVQSLTLGDDELDPDKADAAAVSEVLWNETLAGSRCWLLLFLRMIVLHRAAFGTKSGVSDMGKMVVGLCTLLQHEFVQRDESLFDFVFDITSSFIDELPEDPRLQVRRFVRGKKPTPRMSYLVGGGELISGSGGGGGSGGGEWLKAFQRGKLIDYPMKPWERLAEPSPQIAENDTSISLTLFKTRRARCHKADG